MGGEEGGNSFRRAAPAEPWFYRLSEYRAQQNRSLAYLAHPRQLHSSVCHRCRSSEAARSRLLQIFSYTLPK
jgi:hypothetical protein